MNMIYLLFSIVPMSISLCYQASYHEKRVDVDLNLGVFLSFEGKLLKWHYTKRGVLGLVSHNVISYILHRYSN